MWRQRVCGKFAVNTKPLKKYTLLKKIPVETNPQIGQVR
jgi:hypothetical protein